MTKEAIESWMEAIPAGYQFAFIVVTMQKDEENVELFCRRSTNGCFRELLESFNQTEQVLKESKRQFLKERAIEYLANLLEDSSKDDD